MSGRIPRPRKLANPSLYSNSSPEVIRFVVLMYVRYPLSLHDVEDQPAERGIDVSYETVRFWWTRFGPMFAAEIRRQHVGRMRAITCWRWGLDDRALAGQVPIDEDDAALRLYQ